MTDPKDIRLIIEIKNQQPLELLDLTKSLISVANQFNDYTSAHGDSKENREAKLYIKEIRSGSVIFELIETATIGIIPFLENVNTIVGFAGYIKSAYNYFLGNNITAPTELTVSDYKDLSQIINPVANDNGSQLNISTTINGNVELHLHLNSMEANAIQNIIDREEKKIKIPELTDDVKTKVLFRWYQARNDNKATTGNKGIIEELSNKPLNIIFEDDSLKEKMLHSDDNPFNTVFVVDVKTQYVQQKVIAYKIIRLHESFKIEDDKV